MVVSKQVAFSKPNTKVGYLTLKPPELIANGRLLPSTLIFSLVQYSTKVFGFRDWTGRIVFCYISGSRLERH